MNKVDKLRLKESKVIERIGEIEPKQNVFNHFQMCLFAFCQAPSPACWIVLLTMLNGYP